MSSQYQLAAVGLWKAERAANLLDGGAHFYTVYECADGRHVSVGPIEPEFYALLCEKVGVDAAEYPADWAGGNWDTARPVFAEIFRQRTRDEWCELLEGTDACFAPVLDYEESAKHPHMMARETYVEIEGVRQPAPAPRFSRTPSAVQGVTGKPGSDRSDVLADWTLKDPKDA